MKFYKFILGCFEHLRQKKKSEIELWLVPSLGAKSISLLVSGGCEDQATGRTMPF